MTRVLLHGVPEDLHLWDELRTHLDGDVVALSLPGFANDLPAGFSATKDGYLAWLADAIGKLPGPIDLVGHDWGGILTTQLALTRPELLRSFVTDAVGYLHPEFVWHDLAKIWSTPGAGEQFFAAQAAAPAAQRSGLFVSLGVAPKYAEHLAEPNGVRAQCILSLYRSATTINVDWGKGIAPTKLPALFVIGSNDPFGAPAKSVPYAASLGLRTKTLDGVGHFWPSQAPEAGASALREFWATL